MSPLLAPLLAQLINLQLGARTEGRYVNAYGTRRYEASAAPAATLNMSSRRGELQLFYSPLLTLSPVNREPRQLLAYHFMSAKGTYQARKTTSVQVTTSLGIGSLNLWLMGVMPPLQPAPSSTGSTPDTNRPSTPTSPGGPTPTSPGGPTPTSPGGPTPITPGSATPGGIPMTPGGMPAPGGAPTTPGGPTSAPGGVVTRPPDGFQAVRLLTSANSLGVLERVSNSLQLSAVAGMTATGGRDEESRRFLQTLQAWFVSGSGTHIYNLSKHTALNGNLLLNKTWSSNGTEAASLNVSESYVHKFGPGTTGSVGAGLNLTRFSQSSGLAGFSVFPTFQLALAHEARLGKGRLTFSASAYSTPVLDPLRAFVDPRVGLGGGISYTRDRLLLVTSGGATMSVAPAGNNSGAVNAAQGEARAGYQLAELTVIDTGARIIRQSYGGVNVIPLSWAAFVGVTFGHRIAIVGH